ncbi:MAG: HD domain-containing protein [Ardenticatenaceae bacterium]
MQDWLAACRTVAHDAALAEERERMGWMVHEDREPPLCYRWEHVRRVVGNARWLLAQLPADQEVVIAAAWLHDVKKGAKDHGALGAEFAREFLPTTDFPPDRIEAAADAIMKHVGLFRPANDWSESEGAPFRPAPPLQPIEAAIVWDADKLSKVGPVGLVHFMFFELAALQRRGESMTTEAFHEPNRRWLDTVAPRILMSFNTIAAQRKAFQLHAAYESFWLAEDEALRLGSES